MAEQYEDENPTKNEENEHCSASSHSEPKACVTPDSCKMSPLDMQYIQMEVPVFVFSKETDMTCKGPSIPEQISKQLYSFCTRRPSGRGSRGAKLYDGEELMVNIKGNSLSRQDASTLAPRHEVSNMVMMFAGMLINQQQSTLEEPSRFCLHYVLAQSILHGLDNYKHGLINKWETLDQWWPKINTLLMQKSKWIFVPMLFENHWWCYGLDRVQKTVFVLDSLRYGHDGDKLLLDELVKFRLKEIMTRLGEDRSTLNFLNVVYVDLSKQSNGYDCGLYTIKYMQLWNGLGMPIWTNDDCKRMRHELLVGWVMDAENEVKDSVIKAAGIDEIIQSNKDESGQPGNIPQTTPHPRRRDACHAEESPDEDFSPKAPRQPQSTITTRIKAGGTRRKRNPRPQGKTPYTSHYTRRKNE